MATESEHRSKADHNQALLDEIDQGRFPDWTATIAFYKAVHLVEMLFAHDNRSSSGSHTIRNQVLKRNYPDIWRQYQPLYNFSRQSRYWCTKVTSHQVAAMLKRLEAVERIVNALV